MYHIISNYILQFPMLYHVTVFDLLYHVYVYIYKVIYIYTCIYIYIYKYVLHYVSLYIYTHIILDEQEKCQEAYWRGPALVSAGSERTSFIVSVPQPPRPPRPGALDPT